MNELKSIVIIPARFSSTRFPGKPLAKISNKSMIQHVYERAARARGVSLTGVATDDPRISEAVERFGLRVHAYCLMPNHYHLLLGTPRANLSLGLSQAALSSVAGTGLEKFACELRSF